MAAIAKKGGPILSIQMLRAVAALSVVLFHINFIGVGAFGVDIFFVISGFIMCHIAARERGDFFLGRLIRIVPLYWTATLCIFAIAVYRPTLLQSTPSDLPTLRDSLLFIPHARPNGMAWPTLFLGWTLNYEMFFYAIFAVCLALFRPFLAPLACAIVLVGAFLIGRLFPLPMPWSFWTAAPVLEFGAGIAAFYLYAAKANALQRLPVAFLALVALGCLAIMIVTSALQSDAPPIEILLPCAFVLFVAVLSLEGRIPCPLYLLAIGDASYSLYLLHPYVERLIAELINPMTAFSWHSAIAALAALTGAILLALASYALLEKPSNRMLRSLVRRYRTRDRLSATPDGNRGSDQTERNSPLEPVGLQPIKAIAGKQ
jgi:peptidoglycan/LPS O-acetylase OafA/YrhL